jgi:DNA-binding transcriptional ArsR family regulator
VAATNPHGDLVLTDPAVVRLVAEATGYAVLTRLQRHGRATADELAGDLGLSKPAVEERLRALAEHELVRPRGGAWEALGTGLLVELPDDEAGEEAVRLLTTRMFVEAASLPTPWWTDDEPRLPRDWRRVGGLINARLWMTTDEVRALNERVEELTAPYARRCSADAPDGARRVRVQCYLMPEPD